MFKTTLTAAAFTVIATLSNAAAPAASLAPEVAAQAPTIETVTGAEQVNYYCEWVTLYDAWGNWVTVWQCY
ncbi:hypothetical protein [Roseisalinus antarcticus]|uniref:Uncharacterized protein n=1 Tax=Roseisalinus antarcticus TaxID=254357 RepID=A0A1Y5U2X7_9RHOB|nr:hypothetical protein [Roseisalinus antarcticus]SLN75585.1 hypothetical protein ROA7023_03992 [Roseisalinus antarcticus]